MKKLRFTRHPAPPSATPLPAPTPAPDPLPRGLAWLAWGSLGLAVVVCFGLWPVSGADLYMHLALGRWTLLHGDVPRVDVVTYPTPASPSSATPGAARSSSR